MSLSIDRAQLLSASLMRVMGRVTYMSSLTSVWQMHGVKTFLVLLELLWAPRAAKSQVTFSELLHNALSGMSCLPPQSHFQELIT